MLLTIKFYFLFSLNTQKGRKSYSMDFFELFSFAYKAFFLLFVFMHEFSIYYYLFPRYVPPICNSIKNINNFECDRMSDKKNLLTGSLYSIIRVSIIIFFILNRMRNEWKGIAQEIFLSRE